MRRLVLPLGAAALVAAAIISAVVTLRPDGPSAPVASDGWSGQAVLCAHRDQPDRLSSVRAGEVLELGSDPDAAVVRSRCALLGSADAPERRPAVDDGHSHFVLGTGADRYDVALVGVERRSTSTTLRAELVVDGDSCGHTAEYRGQLMLLLAGPAGADVPEVILERVPIDC
jgi:hypothetical protein